MSTILSALESSRRLQSSVLFPSTLRLSLDVAAALEAAHRGEELEAGLAGFFARNGRFAELAVSIQWPPPWHMPVRLIDQVTDACAAGELTAINVEERILAFYSSDVLADLVRSWHDLPWLLERMPILTEGIENHTSGRHLSAVCVLLPQIEGILGEAYGRAPNPQNDASDLFRETRLGAVARDFYIRLFRETVTWDSSAPVPDLARNAILHGRATNFGTPKHSLKVILILDAVIGARSERYAPAV
jgi:hypothetical protein